MTTRPHNTAAPSAWDTGAAAEAHLLKARVATLEAAIKKHRRDVWGEGGGVEHDADRELYAVLEARNA